MSVGLDPRGRDDGLGWVSRAVFPDERLRLTLTDGPQRTEPARGERLLARYAVVPSAAAARFLLPLGPRRVTAASVWAYNALRPVSVRLPRALLGLAARVGALGATRPGTLTVSAPVDGVPQEALTLVDHVSARLGGGRWYAAIGVRPPDPNHKPTVQLFDAAGRPRGYAKIGWNGATRDLVRAEAAALARAASASAVGDHPLVPGVLMAGDWSGQAVTVVEPLPARVRGVGAGDPPRVAATSAIARRGGPPTAPRPLAGSAFLDRLRRLAAAAAGTGAVADAGPAAVADAGPLGTAGPPEFAASAMDLPAGRRAVATVQRLADRFGDVSVEFGHWHGDWVPWNLGEHAGQLVAWDWEHSGPDVPLGFDLAHDAFQRSLVLGGASAAAAAAAVDHRLDLVAAELAVEPTQRRMIVQSYLIEMWLRTWRLAVGGAGWNPALHPHLLDEIERRSVD
ncbi:hypothetical protein O7608_28440 [Solwaraspora sp. WMMA2056]|uniref:hypothetical protein n=1 Tax=Solwaraspora sp. WMMA2056 TaxID=3015161 RepID=UPI00259B837C|nr:hypothetical protein [Solwaraspora sp. WMMA2056]WJK40292.1 hypothetical protein O7608_28440 [Solwaraspora sp. WMMA2056]